MCGAPRTALFLVLWRPTQIYPVSSKPWPTQLLRLVSGAVSGKINLCYGLTDTRTHPGQTISSGKIKYNAFTVDVLGRFKNFRMCAFGWCKCTYWDGFWRQWRNLLPILEGLAVSKKSGNIMMERCDRSGPFSKSDVYMHTQKKHSIFVDSVKPNEIIV